MSTAEMATTESGVASAHMAAAETTGMTTETASVTASALCPQGYRQKQCKRRDDSPAPHIHIISPAGKNGCLR